MRKGIIFSLTITSPLSNKGRNLLHSLLYSTKWDWIPSYSSKNNHLHRTNISCQLQIYVTQTTDVTIMYSISTSIFVTLFALHPTQLY